MIKLKNLLKEGYAWERKANGSLPTLEDVQKEYQKKKAQEAVTDQEEEELKDIEAALHGASEKHKDQAEKIGDIVKEVHWISAEPNDLLIGTVLAVEKGVYNQVQWFEFSDDRITIKWFKTGQVEKLPSCYIKIISNIEKC